MPLRVQASCSAGVMTVATNGPHLRREGFVLIQPVGVLDGLVVHLLDDVPQQRGARALVETLGRSRCATLLRGRSGHGSHTAGWLDGATVSDDLSQLNVYLNMNIC